MIKSKQILMFSVCWCVGITGTVLARGGIHPHQDLVDVTPGSRGFNTYVNVVNGNLIHSRPEFYIPGRGLPLTVVFSYNSTNPADGPFGYGWQMNYALRHTPDNDNGDVRIVRADGRVDLFVKQADGTFRPTRGVRDRLETLDQGYRLTIWRDTANNDGDYAEYSIDSADHAYVARIKDRNGNSLKFTYDGSQNLQKVIDAAGRELAFVYTDNKLSRLDDPAGRQWQYAYDAEGNLTQATDPAGATTQYQYASGDHRCTRITDARGSVWQFTYADEKLSSVIDPLNHSAFQFAYDTTAPTTRVTDGNGNVTVYTWDDKGQVVSVTNPLGGTATRQWDDDYFLISRVKAAGNTTTFARDPWGNPLTITDALGQKATYTYNSPFHQITSITDKNGHSSQFDRDPNGNLIRSTDALGHQTSYTYSAAGQILSIKNALGHTTGFEYDTFGRRTKIVDALKGQTTFSYDAVGNAMSRTNANGHTSTFEYDPRGRVTKIVDALGATVGLAYDAVGNMISRVNAMGDTTRYVYDPLNRLTTRTTALGASTTYTYDHLGNRLTWTDARGHTTTFRYDALNRLVAHVNPLGAETRYAHDAANNRISQTDTNGNVTQYAYDALGRQVKTITPLGNTWQYAHDAMGNIINRTDANGKVTSYTYDALNRRIKTTYPDGSVDWEYDAVSNLVRIKSNGGLQDETVYAYDTLNRVVAKTIDYGGAVAAKTISYEYDSGGNRVQATYPEGEILDYNYDPAGRLVGINGYDGATAYEYDAAGRRSRLVYPNGMSVTYDYDENGRAVRMIAQMTDRVVLDRTYGYDATGNKIRETHHHDGTDRQVFFDALNRISSVTYHLPETEEHIYTYDATGHRITKTVNGERTDFTYDDDGRVTVQSTPTRTVRYSYDNNGNRIRREDEVGTTMYTSDYENRLLSCLRPGKPPVHYGYTPEGLKILGSDYGTPIYFGYDGARVISESNEEWQILYNPGISAKEGSFVIYPVYDPFGTSAVEIWPESPRVSETVHVVDFDEFGVKIKGSLEPMTKYYGHVWAADPEYFSNDYHPQTASATAPKSWTQVGINTWIPQSSEFDYNPFVVSDTSPMSEADAIQIKDEFNQNISVGVFLASTADSFYHKGSVELVEEAGVSSGDDPLESGQTFGIYVTDPSEVAQYQQIQESQGQPGPVTSATRYSVIIAGDADTVVAVVRNNLTGREEVAGKITKQAIQQGEPQLSLSWWERVFGSKHVKVSYERNKVWDNFSAGVVTYLRGVIDRDLRRE